MKKLETYFQFEFLFVIIALIMGWRMVYTNPPWQSNDEDRHFYNAYALTKGQVGPKLQDGKIGQELPKNVVDMVRSFQGIPFANEAKVSKKYLTSISKQKVNSHNVIFNPNPSANIQPVGYIPSAIGIWLANATNQSILDVGYWARLFMLFAYSFIVFLAIRTIPEDFKAILFAVSLSPMILYQSASVSYDSMTLALLMLYLALVVKYYCTKGTITTRQIALLIILACLQRLTKDGYFLLYFTALIIPVDKFKDKKTFGLFIVGLLFASFGISYLWKFYLASLDIPKDASNFFQKDFRFNQGESLRYHLNDAIQLITLTIQNIFVQGKLWLRGIVGRFGYSYTLLPAGQVIAWYILFLFTASHKRRDTSTKFKLAIGGLTLINVLMVIVGFFMISPIGAHYIYGLQGRYFAPFVAFILVALIQPNLFKMNQTAYKIGLSVIVLLLLNMSISYMDGFFYNP